MKLLKELLNEESFNISQFIDDAVSTVDSWYSNHKELLDPGLRQKNGRALGRQAVINKHFDKYIETLDGDAKRYVMRNRRAIVKELSFRLV